MTLVEVLYIKMFSKVGKTTKMALNTDDKHINKDKINTDNLFLTTQSIYTGNSK